MRSPSQTQTSSSLQTQTQTCQGLCGRRSEYRAVNVKSHKVSLRSLLIVLIRRSIQYMLMTDGRVLARNPKVSRKPCLHPRPALLRSHPQSCHF